MQTLTLNQTTDVINNVFHQKLFEPVMVKNESGMNYLVLPQGQWQDIFLTLYTSVENIQHKESETMPKMTGEMFTNKWAGFLKDAKIAEDYKEEYYEYLEEKYK